MNLTPCPLGIMKTQAESSDQVDIFQIIKSIDTDRASSTQTRELLAFSIKMSINQSIAMIMTLQRVRDPRGPTIGPPTVLQLEETALRGAD